MSAEAEQRHFDQIRDQISIKYMILISLWLGFIAWMLWEVMVGAQWFLASGPPRPAFLVNLVYYNLMLNLWSLGAAAVFGLMLLNPFNWLNGKRLIFGCTALSMILGRLISGGLFSLVASYAPNGIVVTLLTPIGLMFAGIAVIGGLAFLALALFAIFVAVPVTMFNQILTFENAIHVYRYQARGLTGYIVRAVHWLRNEAMPASPPDDSKGARMATMQEIVKLHHPNSADSMAFGHIGNPFLIKTDKHVLIMASTRSGKGVTLIIPHLLRYRGSAFVLDPKGENARATGRQRSRINDRVHYLDPFGISGKPQSRFNPLSRFTPANMEAESKALAAALFVVTDRQRDHWTVAGQQLLSLVILYVYVSDDIPDDQRDLPTVRKVLLSRLKEALDEMVHIDVADGLLRELAISFIRTPEKEFGSIVSTAQRQTEILDNPYIIECLSAVGAGPEVDFADWHDGTMTVFLCLAAPKFPVFNRWLRLVLTSALDEMTNTLDPPEMPVCFMLDELATLGHLPAIENAVGLAAGYGIQLINVFQDVAQMKDLYNGRWASFIGNAGVRAVFNLDDFDTANYWSQFIGGTIFETRSRQQDIYGLSKGDNVGETMRPLMPPEKLMMDFAVGKMLVLAQGAHPIITDRIAYWNDKALAGAWDDPRVQPKMPAAPMTPPPQKQAPVARPATAAPGYGVVNVNLGGSKQGGKSPAARNSLHNGATAPETGNRS